MSTKPKYTIGSKHYVRFADKMLTIMAYADGYYMVRYRGSVPFVKFEKELTDLFTKTP